MFHMLVQSGISEELRIGKSSYHLHLFATLIIFNSKRIKLLISEIGFIFVKTVSFYMRKQEYEFEIIKVNF